MIFCHGYKGFKDWGAWNLVSEQFLNKGYAFCKFNFSLNGGTIKDPIDFPDLDAFGRNTYSQEVIDIGRVLDHVLVEFQDKIDPNNISLIGHSRGGGIVLLRAAQDKRIKTVITWAGVADFKSRFPNKDNLIEWKKEGVHYILNGRTKQKMPHYYSFYEDFIKNEAQLTIQKAVRSLKIPQLIIHGTEDEAVPIKEANDLHNWNPSSKIIKYDTNHTFGSRHPWDEKYLSKIMMEIVDNSINFISNYNT